MSDHDEEQAADRRAEAWLYDLLAHGDFACCDAAELRAAAAVQAALRLGLTRPAPEKNRLTRRRGG